MKRNRRKPISNDIGSKEMISLNDKLVSDFSIEELETRLETDPLMLLQVFGTVVYDGGDGDIEPLCACRKLTDCPELECVCRGGYSEPPICNPVCEFEVGI